MNDPWFQSLFADRIGGANYGKGTQIYKFEKIKRAKRAALADHPERKLLDFGIGENDDMADPIVRDTLKREVDKLENRGYAITAGQAHAARNRDAGAGRRRAEQCGYRRVTGIDQARGGKAHQRDLRQVGPGRSRPGQPSRHGCAALSSGPDRLLFSP